MKELLLVCIGNFLKGGARYLRGTILSLLLVLARERVQKERSPIQTAWQHGTKKRCN